MYIYICIYVLYIWRCDASRVLAKWVVCLLPPAFSLHHWLAPLFNSNAKMRAECVSLSLPVYSLSIRKPFLVPLRGITHQLGSMRTQAKLRGLGGGLTPRCVACRPTGMWKCQVLTNQTPCYGLLAYAPPRKVLEPEARRTLM